MMVARALLISLLTGLITFGITEQLEDPVWSFEDSDDEVCVAPTVNCSGGWQALALAVSEDIKMKSKIRRQNMALEITRKEMEEAGMDIFDIPIPPAVSLEKNFFQVLEEAVPEMKKHASPRKYDEQVAKFMRFLMNRINRDIQMLNKTIHIELIGPDGFPTGLGPVIQLLDEHMQNREDDMQMPF